MLSSFRRIDITYEGGSAYCFQYNQRITYEIDVLQKKMALQ